VTEEPILAAGTLIWRRAAPGIEVGVVHRPRYDDWSLPKGKPEPGEHLTVCALRELREETGLSGVLARPLGTVGYDTSLGPKVVHYWTVEIVDADPFAANDECDALVWLAPAAATTRLTYDHDRALLQRATSLPLDTSTVLLVRHARAGDRRLWKGHDGQRPLDPTGLAQARELAPLLRTFGPTSLHSADRVRCIQTLEPLALDLELAITVHEDLGDETVLAETTRAALVARDWSRRTSATVLCSQGDAIPALVELLCAEDGIAPARPRYPARKGSVWVLSFHDGRLLTTDYLPDGAPGTW
jgi:8-oxo-dGTP pyrophosphatase MutT (NUDIX family)